MSLIDEVKSVEDRVIARLRELGPAVAEYQALQGVAERLGISDRIEPLPEHSAATPPAEAPADAPRKTRRSSSRRTARKPAARKPAKSATAAGGRGAKAAKAKPATGQQRAARRRAAKQADGGDSDRLAQGIVAAVAGEPGLTVADLAARLDVAANVLYRPVRRLTDEGALTKRGRGLHPSGG